jgi:hypothetical protein
MRFFQRTGSVLHPSPETIKPNQGKSNQIKPKTLRSVASSPLMQNPVGLPLAGNTKQQFRWVQPNLAKFSQQVPFFVTPYCHQRSVIVSKSQQKSPTVTSPHSSRHPDGIRLPRAFFPYAGSPADFSSETGGSEKISVCPVRLGLQGTSKIMTAPPKPFNFGGGKGTQVEARVGASRCSSK